MLSKKGQSEDAPPPLLEREGQQVDLLTREAHQWLGPRYEWYNKIRTAKKGGLKLFKDASLEEQMEATRSALVLVTNTLNTALMMGFNSVVDAVKNAKAEPEGWFNKIEGDRSDPPPLNSRQDALIIAWMPLKFLNTAKPVRDKGKGLDFYVDGVVKKAYFKVIAYYNDPRNWAPERLGYFLSSLDPDAGLQEVQGKLGGLKSELDIFTNSLQMFKFGKAARRKEAGQKNTIDDTFEISDAELLRDLYLQTFILTGMDRFLFRYYVTLLTCTENPRAMRQLTQIFKPALEKIIALNQRFQSSFATERDKLRLRKHFMEFQKKRDSMPPVETVEEKGKQFRRINYSLRLVESNAYSRGLRYSERHQAVWNDFLSQHVLSRLTAGVGYTRLLEIFKTMIVDTACAMEGKILAAGDMRAFADEQEKLGKLQVAKQKKALDDTKRKKTREIAKFRSQEQLNMVEVVSKELDGMMEAGQQKIQQMEEAIQKRREAMIARVEQLEKAARQDREENLGKNASTLYELVAQLDESKEFRGGLVPFLVNATNEDKEEVTHQFFRNMFSVITDLFPTEKMMLRNAVENIMALEENDLKVSEEELEAYNQQILTRKTELNTEVPGILEQKLAQGPVPVKVDQLLDLNLTPNSLRLLFTLNFAGPNKPSGKLPGEAVKKLLMINQLAHPLPENDITLPNVEENAPAMKRVNFNRLQKLMT